MFLISKYSWGLDIYPTYSIRPSPVRIANACQTIAPVECKFVSNENSFDQNEIKKVPK